LAELTAADVARYPLPGANAPVGIGFSPDGRWVSFLWSPEHSLRRDLFVLDLDTGERRAPLAAGGGVTEENLSLEERLRRERARDLGQGVTSATWAQERARLLVPRPDGLHVLDAPDFSDRLAVPLGDGAPMLDPQLSPDGTQVAFVQDDELHVADLERGAVRQLTTGARGTGRTNGLAEFVAQEEMGRSHGFWWSPDGARLAFTEVDETHIPVYRIVHQGSDAVGDGAQEDHRYPFAGAANAVVRLGIVPAAGGDPVWAQLGSDWEYLARVDWLAGDRVAVQLENREQTRLDVVAVDPSTGTATPLLQEESDVWINLHDVLRPIPDGSGSFLWASERTGFRHLEVRTADGALVRTLTDGPWLVDAVVALDERHVWFSATADGHLDRHLYGVPLTGGDLVRVTAGRSGTHHAVVHGASGRFVDTYSSLTTPPVATVRSLADGADLHRLVDEVEGADPRASALPLPPPELLTVTTDDGATIDALVYRPVGDAPFPTVVSVYGGPHVQQVANAWGPTASMRRQWLRHEGYLVVVADNRGAAGRGLAFEGVIRHDAGEVEVRDQVAVVEHLVARGLADPERVGINGWSYGGYLSAMALAKAPTTFKAAVAGAPVTHWDGYDTHYTERYLGTPQANAEGYERSSVMAHVGGLRDRHLMLVHGLIDENVHFRHSARLINALIRERIPYELFLLPDERHSPRAEADRVYLEERILDFFRRRL